MADTPGYNPSTGDSQTASGAVTTCGPTGRLPNTSLTGAISSLQPVPTFTDRLSRFPWKETNQGKPGGFVRVDVKVKHVSATRQIPLVSFHSKDDFQVVNYCRTEKRDVLIHEVVELTQLSKMHDGDCDDTQEDDFVMISKEGSEV